MTDRKFQVYDVSSVEKVVWMFVITDWSHDCLYRTDIGKRCGGG